MVLDEDTECSVCFQPYSRGERVPRVLHCDHTFCASCLELMATHKDHLLTVCCPLCRRTTCISPDRGVRGSLWVNADLWEMISESEEEQCEGNHDNSRASCTETQPSLKEEWLSSKNSRLKLKLPTFLRKYNVIKQQQQHEVRSFPSSNVEMKSWRKLTTEEII